VGNGEDFLALLAQAGADVVDGGAFVEQDVERIAERDFLRVETRDTRRH
jgi:hypothetical protein